MATCLVISDKELKSYNNLGISMHEVQRDYLEYGVLRSPMAIKHKINLRESEIPGLPTGENTDFQQFMNEAEDFDNKTAEGWVYKLTKALDVEAETISREQAKNIHASKEQAYDNEDSFFTDGKAYFVEGTLTPESVVHEFSHPLIKSLDPAVKEKLYQDLMNDPNLNGQAIVDEVAKKYGENFDIERGKEEVLVRALTKMTLQEENTPNTDNWLGKILYAIRQALRKLIGKRVNVRNLDGNTTLKDLAKMLAQGDIMDLQKDLITSADVIEYFKNRKEFVENFDELLKDQNKQGYHIAQNMINETMKVARNQKERILENPDLFPLIEVLVLEVGENNKGLITDIENNLKGEAQLKKNKKIIESIIETEDYTPTVDVVEQRLLNLSKSLFKINELFDTMIEFETKIDKNGNKKISIKEGTGQISKLKDADSKQKIQRLLYYKQFMQEWVGKYNSENPIESVGIIDVIYNISLNYEDTHPLKELAQELYQKSQMITDKINEIQRDAVKEYMYEILESPATQMLNQFESDMEKRKNSPQSIRDRMYRDFHNMTEKQYKDYKKLKSEGKTKSRNYRFLHQLWLQGNELDRDKIDEMLKGKTGDAKFIEGMWESASQNPDAQIQSVFKHMQSLKAEWEGKALKFHNDFVTDISSDLQKVNVNFENRGSVGRDMGFKDTKGIEVKVDGITTIEKVEEWVFLNPWRDYRYDQKQLENDLNNAIIKYNETKSEKDEQIAIDAQRKLQEWKNKYMHQEFDVKFYETRDLLIKDKIGREAKKRRDDIFEEINQFLEENQDGKHDDIIEQLNFKLKELSSTTDILGNKKTGLDLQIAERLKEYNEANSDFYEQDEIPGEFQKEYDDYSKYLINVENLDKKSDDYKNKMEDWLKKNTRVVLKNSVYEKRKKLIEEKQQILKLLDEENKKIFDDVDEQSIINEQANIIKDNGNQPEGGKATSEARKKVLDAHKKIEEKRKLRITRSGLTAKENARLKELQNIVNENGSFTSESQKEEYTALVKKQNEISAKLGLNSVTLKRLKEIDAQLRGMGGRTPTDHYKRTMIQLIENAGGEQLFIEFAKKNDEELNFMEEAYNDDFEQFLNSEEGQKLIEDNEELRTFVEENHYETEEGFKATNLWYTSISEDPYDYRTKKVRKADGTSEFIEIDDMFRIPASRFYIRKVKEKYTTKKVIGKTVDNANRFLPKEENTNRYRNAEYYDLKENQPEKFEFMEKIKKHYLKAQEFSKDDKDKLYLTFPRTRKTRTENIITGNVLRWKRRAKEWYYGSEDDVFDIKTESKRMSEDKSLGVTSAITTQVGLPVMGVTENKFGRRMHVDDISTDILKTIPEYMASLFQKNAAIESNSYARTMQDIVNRTDVETSEGGANTKSLLQESYNLDTPDVYETKKGTETKRKKVIDALVERELDGIFLKGIASDKIWLNKTLGAMTSRASKINFNWNIFSGIVNYGQMKTTAITHAIAGDDFTYKDGAKGEIWAFDATSKISAHLRRRGKVKTLEEQTIMLFDAISGRATETIGDNLSRTILGDVIEGKAPQRVRKWLELQGTIQNFASLMYNKKVTITDADGNSKKIPYIKAFELNEDGNIQTKEGVESDYAVTYNDNGDIQFGKKFIEQKEYMQNVIMKINGAFAKQDAPLIARNVFYKQLMYLKKHVVPLFVKSYEFSRGFREDGKLQLKKRVNWTTGKAQYGYHIQTLRYARDFIQSASKGHFLRWTSSERSAFIFTAFQIVMGYIILPYLWKLLTPWDDDEDGIDYTAMKNRSGYYDAPYTVDQETYFFRYKGWLLNGMSYITRKMMDEYNSVNVFHPVGIAEYLKHGTSQSVGAVQTFGFLHKILGMVTGDRPTVASVTSGPYWFQQKDAVIEVGGEVDEMSYRISDPYFTFGGRWAELLFDFVGANSKIIDPVNTQRAYEAGRRMN